MLTLAFIMQREGRADEAIAMFERVLADTSRVLGQDHPDTLKARQELAETLLEAGRVD